jgi:hypothetical protein
MTTEQAEAALQAWATVQRDELVHAAHQAGVSKNRIHVLTGVARTTIDRILEAPMGTTQLALTDYLARFTAPWPKSQPWGWPLASPGVASQYTARDVAGWLLKDTEFRALKLGTWLSTPDGQLLAAAVGALAPPPYGQDAELLITALQLAAQQQQAEARQKILAGVAVGGVLALAFGSAGR